MASIFEGIDQTDPCALWPVLQSAADRLLAGEMVTRARFGDEEHEYQRGDLAALQARIRELRAECDRLQGARPRRRAFTFG